MKIKKLKGYQIAIIVFAAVIAAGLIWGGVYCAVNDESPSELIHDVVTPDDEQLIGKWQGEKAITGYEFYDDGSYDNYLLGFSTKKYYEINGNKLTLKSNTDNRRVVYKFKINGDKLTLTLIESEGKKRDGKDKQTYTRVKHFNFKTATEAIQDLAEELKDDKTEETEEESEEETEEASDSEQD